MTLIMLGFKFKDVVSINTFLSNELGEHYLVIFTNELLQMLSGKAWIVLAVLLFLVTFGIYGIALIFYIILTLAG